MFKNGAHEVGDLIAIDVERRCHGVFDVMGV
jgi:hypothetical protein